MHMVPSQLKVLKVLRKLFFKKFPKPGSGQRPEVLGAPSRRKPEFPALCLITITNQFFVGSVSESVALRMTGAVTGFDFSPLPITTSVPAMPSTVSMPEMTSPNAAY